MTVSNSKTLREGASLDGMNSRGFQQEKVTIGGRFFSLDRSFMHVVLCCHPVVYGNEPPNKLKTSLKLTFNLKGCFVLKVSKPKFGELF
jgi:hypothetical protein